MKHPFCFTGKLLVIALLLSLTSAKTKDVGTLMYYWNFNDVPTFADPTVSVVAGSIIYTASGSSALITGDAQNFEAANARNGDPAGSHLRLNSPIGASLVFKLATTGFDNIMVKYETRRSGSGAGTQKVSYTTNGTDFIAFQTVTVVDGTPPVVTLDFTAIEAVNNNPDFAVKIEFEAGGGGAGGNNRFDNVTVESFETILAPPGTLEPSQPADEAIETGLRPNFEWTEADNATSYQLQVSKSDDFSLIVGDLDEISGVSKQINVTLEEDVTYYWRVRGLNEAGEGDWSETRSFTTVEEFQALDIRLNEISASNKTFVADEDGDFSDWIEVYNESEEDININGFGLSDDSANPFKWTFPNITLQPGEYILVWASDKNRSVAEDELHTNFKIGAEGESITITSADGVPLDVSPAVAMDDDQSYGRSPDGHGQWALTTQPTPGETNGAGSAPLSITSFKFEKQYNHGHLKETIVCDIYGDSLIVGIISHQQDPSHLKATFNAGSAESITVDDHKQKSTRTMNNFSESVFYTLTSGENEKTYEVRLVYTGLPVVYVETDGGVPIASKETYVTGQVKVYPANGDAIFTGATSIRGRGNYTWTLPKKAYRIKLASSAGLLGMPADKDWVLLANYADKTLIRNSLAFHIGQQTNLAWTPNSTPVELVVNGVYYGSYLFGEHIKVSEDRVDIEELEENDEDEEIINGGYFLQVDVRLDGDTKYTSSHQVPFVFESPEEPNEVQYNYITNYIEELEEALYSENFADPDEGYAKYLDTETFLDWYWINEVSKNTDADFTIGIYLYKERNGKFKFGPIWDFDIGFGNVNFAGNDNPSGYWVRLKSWTQRLFEDPAFQQKAKEHWNSMRDGVLSDLPGVIDDLAAPLGNSQEQNFRKWDILNVRVHPNPVVTGSYQGEIDYMKKWLNARVAWIDAEVNKPALSAFALHGEEPLRIVATPNLPGNVIFSWDPSTPGSTYKVLVDQAGGDFTSPLATFNTDFYNLYTTSTIKVKDLAKLFDNFPGVDSVDLKWTVYSYQNSDSLAAIEPMTIRLIDGLADVPDLISPVMNETVETLTPTFKWHKTFPASNYQLQVSLHQDFPDAVIIQSALTDTTYTANESLADETTYYWRVRSLDGDKASAWSNVWTFITPTISGLGEDPFGVSLYPNPSTKELFIDVPSFLNIERAEFVDAIGQRTASFEVTPGRTTKIDVAAFSRGMYVVIMRGQGNTVVTRKILLH